MDTNESKKIKYKFVEHRYNYELPLLGVDLDFLAERKIEIKQCLEQLAIKIGQLNIASAKGVSELNLANKLVKYYWYAMCTVKKREALLVNGDMEMSAEEIERQAVYMHKATRERTK
jgi:hypothetical protein